LLNFGFILAIHFIMYIPDLPSAKAAAFPHYVDAHLSHRCTAGSFLAKQGIRRGKDYRRVDANPRHLGPNYEWNDRFVFRLDRHAIAFRMWLPSTPKSLPSTLNKIILPMIRRVMPGIIAADICGVQPMTGPNGALWTLQMGQLFSLPLGKKQPGG
jgi:hypothetical protein